MPDLDEAFDGLTEPGDLSLPFGKRVAEFLSRLPEPVVMVYALSLLEGDDPGGHPTALRYMGGGHAVILLDSRDFTLWPAIWGARAMQYVWTPQHAAGAARLVVGHLADDRWRVAEMCSKVVGKRELAEGADALVPLAGHWLPRVRMQAIRALGRVGEREHLEVVRAGLADEDPDVRRAAGRAIELRAAQLDLDLDDVMEGRFTP